MQFMVDIAEPIPKRESIKFFLFCGFSVNKSVITSNVNTVPKVDNKVNNISCFLDGFFIHLACSFFNCNFCFNILRYG